MSSHGPGRGKVGAQGSLKYSPKPLKRGVAAKIRRSLTEPCKGLKTVGCRNMTINKLGWCKSCIKAFREQNKTAKAARKDHRYKHLHRFDESGVEAIIDFYRKYDQASPH